MISIGIVVMAFVFAAFYVGYQRGLAGGTKISITGVANGDRTVADADFNLFWEAWQKLKDLHIDADQVTSQDLVYGAISGLAASFDDPHTSFFPPEKAKMFEQDVAGNFGGIGAEIGFNKERILSIIAPLKDSPAEKSGLESGDLILKINEEATNEFAVDEAVSRIRGTVGTAVTLTVYREGWVQPRDFRIVRDVIEVPTLDLSYKDGSDIAYLQYYSFNENAPLALSVAARQLIAAGARGIILDLRDNPGGYLEVAIHNAGLFVENDQVVVSQEFKNGDREPFLSKGSGTLKDLPVVILINGGSASASEILAGALRDLRGVKLVGEQSYGKGTVQELEHLSDDSSLKITIARWVMPAGEILDSKGLTPDYQVELTDADIESGQDPQLEKALEVLRAQL